MKFRRLMTIIVKRTHVSSYKSKMSNDFIRERFFYFWWKPRHSTLFGFLCKHQTVPQHHFHKRIISPSTPKSRVICKQSLCLLSSRSPKNRGEKYDFLVQLAADFDTRLAGVGSLLIKADCMNSTKLSIAAVLTQFDALIKRSLS